MNKVRKSMKAYIIAVFLFAVLSAILACVICLSGFRESWIFAGLIAILSAVTFVLGILQVSAVGKRGIIVGLVSATVFIIGSMLIACSAFSVSMELNSKSIFYLIPLISGGIGGFIGAGKYGE